FVRKSVIKVLNFFTSLQEVAVGLLQFNLDVAHLPLRPLAFGNVAGVALNHFSSVFVVKVTDEFHFIGWSPLVLKRQVFVANKVLFLQLPKGQTTGFFIFGPAY